MSITPFGFTPTQGLRDSTAYPTNPGSEAAARDNIQKGMDQIKDYLNGVTATLWHDNGVEDRSACYTSPSASQTLNVGVTTKLNYQTVFYDHLSEYTSGLSRITVKKSGIYLIAGNMRLYTIADGQLVSLYVYINGIQVAALAQRRISTSGGFEHLSGCLFLKPNANDYIELYAIVSDGATNGVTDTVNAFFEVCRIV